MEQDEQKNPMRRDAIYQLTVSKKMVNVNELSQQMGVTPMTIRRDLEYLEKKGLVERVHGGAIPSKHGLFEPLFSQKNQQHVKEKDAIAQMAATMIENYETLFINSGTTTLRIFTKITAHHVKIVTNNACFPMVKIPEYVDVISTGGSFNSESFTYYGDIASQTIQQTWATKAFVGVDGIDIEHGLTTPLQADNQVNRMMIEHTRGKVIVVTDSSKIGKVSNFFIEPISVVNTLITDNGISDKAKEDFIKLGIQVIIV